MQPTQPVNASAVVDAKLLQSIKQRPDLGFVLPIFQKILEEDVPTQLNVECETQDLTFKVFEGLKVFLPSELNVKTVSMEFGKTIIRIRREALLFLSQKLNKPVQLSSDAKTVNVFSFGLHMIPLKFMPAHRQLEIMAHNFTALRTEVAELKGSMERIQIDFAAFRDDVTDILTRAFPVQQIKREGMPVHLVLAESTVEVKNEPVKEVKRQRET